MAALRSGRETRLQGYLIFAAPESILWIRDGAPLAVSMIPVKRSKSYIHWIVMPGLVPGIQVLSI